MFWLSLMSTVQRLQEMKRSQDVIIESDRQTINDITANNKNLMEIVEKQKEEVQEITAKNKNLMEIVTKYESQNTIMRDFMTALLGDILEEMEEDEEDDEEEETPKQPKRPICKDCKIPMAKNGMRANGQRRRCHKCGSFKYT